MSEEAGRPALEPTLTQWPKAREETRGHLAVRTAPSDETWAQRLADLLATEQTWQARYAELVGPDSPRHGFPLSNR
ncbi:hypothetical protein [Amycolatopsis sp. FDAARGOS 1241]|uniref:hypothetical protein n=1 Tax=Amycolatopsis sp. FDAARGOS 1241 TaxID=2778070 RepID=UPI0019506A9B|nr:hypothetical protein [Amycolatopsis sp. FDAARGOS 1241]QRP42718.1 hypothetical protein I6J71_24845 [Amycolatopsis sp. FDAARGOS 1241]